MSRTFYAPLKRTLVPAQASGDATATFTRATTATVIDHEGIVRPVLSGEARFYGARRVRNCLSNVTSSQSLTVAGGWTVGVDVTSATANAGVAPDGTTTATRVIFSGAGISATNAVFVVTQNWGNGGSSASQTSAVSFWVRATSGTANFRINNTQSAVIVNTSSDLVATTTWQRFAFVITFTAAPGNGEVNLGLVASVANDAADLLVWGAQCENVTGQSNTAPGEYVSNAVLSAPYHGANVDGVLYRATVNGNSVASNVVTEATGAAIADATLRGYLGEPAATNRALRSEEFDNAAWVKTNVTVAANSIAAPDGTTTADTLTASAGNGTVIQDLGVVGSAAKTGSVWLKRLTGTGNIDLTMDNGSTWTTVAVTSSWTRFSVTQTLANEDFGIRIVTSADAVYAWGGQVETGPGSSVATSYIPTTTLAVVRNADSLTFAASGNISSTIGTIYTEAQAFRSSSGGDGRMVSGAVNSYGLMWGSSDQIRYYDGTNLVGTSTNWTPNVRFNAALTYSGIVATVYLNGGGATTGAFAGTFDFATNFQIGSSLLPTIIRNVKIWNTVLPINAAGSPIDSEDPMVLTTTAITPSDSGSIDYDGFMVASDGQISINDDAGNPCTLKVEAGRVHSIRIKRVYATGTTVTGVVGVTF